MQAISFSWSVYLVYGYMGVLLLEVLLERKFRTNRWLRPVGVFAILILAASFVFGFVYAPDPLSIRVRNINGDKDSGTKVGGIAWRPEYTDSRIVFSNTTDNDYHNLDFIVSLDRLITAEGQTTNTPGVQLYNTIAGPDVFTITRTSAEGKKNILPEERTTPFAAGIRVTCDKLIKHGGTFEVVLAIAQPLVPMPSEAFDSLGNLNPRFMAVVNVGRDAAYGPRVSALTACVNGSYESRGSRPRQVHNCYPAKAE